MKKTTAKIVSIFLIISIIFCLSACNQKSETGIYNLSVEPLSEQKFYKDLTYSDFELTVGYSSEFDTNDVNVVIADSSIIDISFNKEDGLILDYISFNIICKAAGTTTFYFETPDKLVKSDEIEITVATNIKSINFVDDSTITFNGWSIYENRDFEIESDTIISEPKNILEFVSENPKVATIKYDEDSWLSESCIIEQVSEGETYVYIQTKDKTIQSKKIKVIVEKEDEYETSEEIDSSPEDEIVDNSRTVYTTPYGKKYHYSKSCAGKNANPTTENAAKKSYDPCKKCAK